MFIQTESTPNPNSLKFILEDEITTNQTFEFNSIEDCSNSELAAQLFNIDGIESIFFGSNFISINKHKYDWDQLKASILTKIADYLSSGKSIVTREFLIIAIRQRLAEVGHSVKLSVLLISKIKYLSSHYDEFIEFKSFRNISFK